MYLKSIDVQGFKSFANKMTFKFNKGITGIVGPNGSGKSNVADAVRWVLGEQSAKQLRGSKMEDVIFSGTESRKPLGFAYVAITLDNKDHKLAIDYDEVTIARRVYRSGESEYLMNGHTCRLRDVQELFFDTGIGKEGYSIIGQGQIDKILSGKPDERRELFDEAVGIVKYKKRKIVAEKNLETEKQNLYRVKDILSELEKQVKPLERQAETARTYLKLRDKLKSYDVNMYLSEYGRIKQQLKEVTEKITIVQQDYDSSQKEFVSTKETYEQLEQEIETYNQQIDENRTAFNALQLNREKLEGEVKVLTEQVKAKTLSKEHQIHRLTDIEQSLEEKKTQIQACQVEKEELDAKRSSLESAKTTAEAQLEEMNAKIAKIRADIEHNNGEIIESLNEAASVKAKIQRYNAMAEQIQIRKAELNQRLIALKSEETNGQEMVETYKRDLDNTVLALQNAKDGLEGCKTKALVVQEAINRLRQSLTNKEQEFHGLNSKYTTLKNITDRYDGYGSSIKRVMEQKDRFTGIHGVVADIIKVEKTYETAIEIALGGSIQNIVTDNEQTAKQLISYLKQNRFGRATFLPLTGISSRGMNTSDKVLSEPGVLGIASQLVDYDRMYGGLAEYLLGRIIVVDHIDHGLAIAKKYHHSLRIVTLDGESLSPGGSMSGGAYKSSSNLLSRHREITEIEENLIDLKRHIEQLNKDLDEAHNQKRNNKQQIEILNGQLQQLKLKENTTRLSLNQMNAAQDSNAAAYAELKKEMAELNTQMTDVQAEKNALNSQYAIFEDRQKLCEALVSEYAAALETELEKEKSFNETTADIRVDFSNILQKGEFISQTMGRLWQESKGLMSEKESVLTQMTQSEGETQEKLQAIKAQNEEIQALTEASRIKEELLKKALEAKESVSKGHKEFFTKREELSQRISQLDKELFRLNHQQEKLNDQRSSQSNYMWEEYELTFQGALALKDEAMAYVSHQELKKMTVELKNQIKTLGPVNVNAIEEYQNVSQRYALLKTQHDDLVEAEAKLQGIIESLDKAMRQQFSEKFHLIQREFDRVFSLLFGGGKGTLEIDEGEDVLYAGIRIIAQPPGKKLQNMMQLSGGEKALTAIALLFAIQSLKPSPFCLLDEIEAALDDANVKRYAEYLHNLTKDTQFIVITHRRGTMKAADVLYGITMQEKGVSTLVSVNLIENELSK